MKTAKHSLKTHVDAGRGNVDIGLGFQNANHKLVKARLVSNIADHVSAEKLDADQSRCSF